MLVKVQGSKLDGLSKTERGSINAALKSIREAMPPNTTREELAREMERRAGKYRKEWPNAALTASALAKHWSRYAAAEPMADTVPKLAEPSWDWAYVVSRCDLNIAIELPWASLKAEKQHRIVECYNSLPPFGFEFWLDDNFGMGWEEWEVHPSWHTLGGSDRGRVREFLSDWEPDCWREVWTELWTGECPGTWDEVRDAAKHAVLGELRSRMKK